MPRWGRPVVISVIDEVTTDCGADLSEGFFVCEIMCCNGFSHGSKHLLNCKPDCKSNHWFGC